MADAKQKQGGSGAETGTRARAVLTTRQLLQLATEVVCHPSTVQRWADGERVTESTDIRLRRAAEKLGIKMESP